MPFVSQKQRKACYATHGFHGAIDCHEWAHAKGSKDKGGIMMKKLRGKPCMACGGSKKTTYQMGGKKEFPSVYRVNSESPQFDPSYKGSPLPIDSTTYNIDFRNAQRMTPEMLKHLSLMYWGAGLNLYDVSRKDTIKNQAAALAFQKTAAYDDYLRQRQESAYNQFSATPVSRRPFQRGGSMQKGGCFDAIGNQIPCEGQQLQEKNPGYSFTRSIPTEDRLMLEAQRTKMLQGADPALTTPIQEEGEASPYKVNPIQNRNGQWVIPQEGKKVDPFFAMRGVRTGLSWLSGIMERKRQDEYMRNQLAILNQRGTVPYQDYQPNPTNPGSAYFRYGGTMKGGGLSRDKNYGSKEKPYPSVSSSDFAGGHRSYPIPTRADAVDALRLAHLHGRSDVIAKVHAKYPDLKHGGIAKKMHKKRIKDTDKDMDSMNDTDMDMMKKGGNWIQGAIKHPGRCTPISKPACTGHARALALLFKRKHGFHKK